MSYANRSDAAFDALGDPVRRAIVAELAAGPRAVQDIAAGFSISRPAISRHLKVLGQAGLVSHSRAGKQNLYALDEGAFAEVRAWLDNLWDNRLRLLKRLAEGDA
jgi:DNA-binding transcriptional ArsR family regulator